MNPEYVEDQSLDSGTVVLGESGVPTAEEMQEFLRNRRVLLEQGDEEGLSKLLERFKKMFPGSVSSK
jgi:hypothetical protein